MATTFQISEQTEQYFQAQSSLVLSNGDKEFKDRTDHSPELVSDVIDSYYRVVVLPMFESVQVGAK